MKISQNLVEGFVISENMHSINIIVTDGVKKEVNKEVINSFQQILIKI